MIDRDILRTRLAEIQRERTIEQENIKSLDEESEAIEAILALYDVRSRTTDNRRKTQSRPDAIRSALAKLKTASPKSVADQMTRDGWNWNGVNAAQITAVELNRISKMDSRVERVDRGVYRFVERKGSPR